LRSLEIESDEAVVVIVVESIKNFSMSFYSPFSVQYSGSYGRLKIDVDFQSITMQDLFKFWGPFLKCLARMRTCSGAVEKVVVILFPLSIEY
jgi:hypothetical protein